LPLVEYLPLGLRLLKLLKAAKTFDANLLCSATLFLRGLKDFA
jgi:hypothetical protein